MAVGSSDLTTTPLFFIIAVSWNETFDQPDYRAFRTTRASELYRTNRAIRSLQIPIVGGDSDDQEKREGCWIRGSNGHVIVLSAV